MEITGAGYTLTDSAANAQYTVRLEVRPNMVTYDDGSVEQAPPGEPQFLLHLTLVDNMENYDMVSFAFPFTELEEMYDFNLKMVYEAMANVPITRLGDIEIIDESDAWRNKWLYLRASFDAPVISVYFLQKPGFITDGGDPPDTQSLDHYIGTFVGATIGLELQFLNWMSLEANIIFRFSEPFYEYAFIPGIGLQWKFPFKPAKHYMLEPYIMGAVAGNTSGNSDAFPLWGVGGGMQFGTKGGNMGAFFIDANYQYFFGETVMRNRSTTRPNPTQLHYNHRQIISIGFGYKIGFFDR